MSETTHEDLIGLIPAAGQGLRLGLPYPKELYPIIRDNRFKPVAQHVVENLVAAGVQHTVFVINETKHQLIGYFGDGHRFGCHLTYVVQELSTVGSGPSAGLAQALHAAHHHFAGRTVVFGMADTIVLPVDAFTCMRDARHAAADIVLGCFRTDTPEKFGMVELDADERVRAIIDKPAGSDLEWMWGAILWRPRFSAFLHECLERGAPTDFAGILNAAIGEGLEVRAARVHDGSYIDVGTFEEIALLDEKYRTQAPARE